MPRAFIVLTSFLSKPNGDTTAIAHAQFYDIVIPHIENRDEQKIFFVVRPPRKAKNFLPLIKKFISVSL